MLRRYALTSERQPQELLAARLPQKSGLWYQLAENRRTQASPPALPAPRAYSCGFHSGLAHAQERQMHLQRLLCEPFSRTGSPSQGCSDSYF